jgi:hypothetical protein
MSEISVTVDGSAVTIDSEQRPTQIFAENKEIVVCKINGVLMDLWADLKDGDVVEGISISSPEGLSVLRHSTAHVMAQAVQQVHQLQMASITTSIPRTLLIRKILRRSKVRCARLLKKVSVSSVV